ncbi:MAG: hypothetical protein PF588_04510 [Candidatus Kapabacteria bacterium]|jgi:hypothetical protein|nr:hypothetical protein [Candidatus Kapabacteria bacterium]
MKITKIYYLFLSLFLIVVLPSCNNDDSNVPNAELRMVYYSVDQNDGADPSEIGLYQYNLGNDYSERVSFNSIDYISGISEDGGIYYRYADDISAKYWRKLSTAYIPIPFPESDNDNTVYEYIFSPILAGDFKGNYCAYFVNKKQAGNPDPLSDRPTLLIYNNVTLAVQLIDFKEFCLENMTDYDVDMIIPYGENMVISTGGAEIWFQVCAFKEGETLPGDTLFQLYKWSQGELLSFGDPIKQKSELLGYDPINRELILSLEDKYYHQVSTGEFLPLGLSFSTKSNLKMFAGSVNQYVFWSDFGIEKGYIQGETEEIISWEELKTKYSEIENDSEKLIFEKNDKISIAADGEYVICAFPTKADETLFDIILFSADGKDFRRIAKDVCCGAPVISGPIQK